MFKQLSEPLGERCYLKYKWNRCFPHIPHILFPVLVTKCDQGLQVTTVQPTLYYGRPQKQFLLIMWGLIYWCLLRPPCFSISSHAWPLGEWDLWVFGRGTWRLRARLQKMASFRAVSWSIRYIIPGHTVVVMVMEITYCWKTELNFSNLNCRWLQEFYIGEDNRFLQLCSYTSYTSPVTCSVAVCLSGSALSP